MRDRKIGRSIHRILIVDDDEDDRDLANLVLSRAGYCVNVAVDGEEAWQALLSFPYDLLITDQNMPRLCGLDLVTRVRAAGMKLPVILHSAWPCLGRSADYSHLALAAVLHKSADFAEVLDGVRRILSVAETSCRSGEREIRRPCSSPRVTL